VVSLRIATKAAASRSQTTRLSVGPRSGAVVRAVVADVMDLLAGMQSGCRCGKQKRPQESGRCERL
jgi:transposase